MSGTTIQQMADRVAQLMEDRLRIGGNGLQAKLRRAGRALPRKVRRQAAVLAEAAEQARNPRLAMQLDNATIAQAYDACVTYLSPIGRAERRMAVLRGIGAGIALRLFVVGAALIAFLVWRGYL